MFHDYCVDLYNSSTCINAQGLVSAPLNGVTNYAKQYFIAADKIECTIGKMLHMPTHAIITN